MIDNHTATQHEFTRKCIRLFTEDIPPVKLQTLEEEISIFAEGIIHFGGYNLDTQLAALAAERDALRALVERVNELGHRLGGNYAWQNAELVQLLRDCQEALK